MEGIIDKENERARRFFALLDNMEKKVERLARDNRLNPEKPDVPLNKNDAFQKVQKRHVQEKR